MSSNCYSMTTGATGVWSAIATICCAGNSMATAWSNPSSLCKGCGLQDQEHNIGGHLTPWNHTHQVWYWFICVGLSQAGSTMRDSLIVSTEPLSLLCSTSERVHTQVSNVCRRIHPNLVDTHTHTRMLGHNEIFTQDRTTSRAFANCIQAESSSLSMQVFSTHPHPSFHSKRSPSSRQLALLCRRLTNLTSRQARIPLHMTLTCYRLTRPRSNYSINLGARPQATCNRSCWFCRTPEECRD